MCGCPTHRVICDEWDAASRPRNPTYALFHHKRSVYPITDIKPATRENRNLID